MCFFDPETQSVRLEMGVCRGTGTKLTSSYSTFGLGMHKVSNVVPPFGYFSHPTQIGTLGSMSIMLRGYRGPSEELCVL